MRRITVGQGITCRSERKSLPESFSRISALPSRTNRTALRAGTMVSGSKDAFKAKQLTTSPDIGTDSLKKLFSSKVRRDYLPLQYYRSAQQMRSSITLGIPGLAHC